MEKLHTPVLLSEVMAYLQPHAGESYLDLTAGYGGHAKSILDVTLNYKNSVLVDRDEYAAEYLHKKFAGTGITIINSSFYRSMPQLIECGKTFDIILADYGVSSPQLDRADRGFSLKQDGPLDMRMDRRQSLTASDIVNHYSERALADILVKYGEIPSGRANQLSRIIVHHRPITTTLELADLVKAHSARSRIHPATLVFQALRIAVNDELGEIERSLPLLPQLLSHGGRVGIITFHSLEDRLVKSYFRAAADKGEEADLTVLTKKPVIADPQELFINPRARSAKLRVAVRN